MCFISTEYFLNPKLELTVRGIPGKFTLFVKTNPYLLHSAFFPQISLTGHTRVTMRSGKLFEKRQPRKN